MRTAEPVLRRLIEQVRTAAASGAPLDIQGGGTKAFYGEAPSGEALPMTSLRGISSYEPSELVVTARAGTLLAELEAALAERGQCLPFEPPRFAPGGTLGGMVASGLSGPARVSTGALRDYVLGVSLLNARGELLNFGGQVEKNVAGYDVSRLLAGSWGILGVICEVSLKVLPRPTASATLRFEYDEALALAQLHAWSAQSLPLRASSWYQGQLHLRLAGAAAAVHSACERLGGERMTPEMAAAWWASLRDHAHEFFQPSVAQLAAGDCLWRLSLPPTAASLSLAGPQFIEWGGAQRWLRTGASAEAIRTAAAGLGGHATLVRAADKGVGAFTRPSEAVMRVHRRLKLAFDPPGIFNRGRLYADL
jgi:FAD/FMN-containing dehydrogenase